jgi:hypothetical protein
MAAMSLSEQDKERIREEEAYRMKVRQELAREDPGARRKAAIFWIVLVVLGLVLYEVLRTGSHG